MKVSRGSRILCCILFCMLTILTQLNIQSVQAQPTNTPGELPGWPIDLTGARDFTFDIIVTDIDEDGNDEVIIGIDNKVHIIDKTGGNLPGWPQQTGSSSRHEITAVAIGDIDGDGDNEIIGGGENGIYAWHWETGNLVDGWPLLTLTVGGTSTSGDMVLGNFDGDPCDLEIVIATLRDIYLGAHSFDIHVLDHNGFNITGWPQSFDVDSIGHVYLSCGDIDNNGNDEIIAACHRTRYYQSSVYVFHSDGQIAAGWPIQGNGPFVSPAVLCNLDDNDDYEIVAATVNGSHTGRIYAWKPNGVSVSGWPISFNAFHLAAGDLNSDGQPEIIASYSNSTYWGDHLAVINRYGTQLLSKTLELRTGATLGNTDYDTDSEIIIPTWHGKLHVMDIDGQDLPGFPVYLGKGIMSTPSALGDLDGDGDIEIVQLDTSSDKIHAFDLKALKAERPDWPMARHDERRSSLWTPPQTPGFDILEIAGPLQVMENSSTHYTVWAYFEDGSNKDVTLEATWWVDPCYADYAHFEAGGVLGTNKLGTFKDIIIYARYIENDFEQAASYEVRIRPTVQILYVDDDALNDPGPNDPTVSDPDEKGTEQHPFDAIQEAIDVAGDGDTVIVLPGEYYENVDFMGKDFTLTSTNPNDPSIVASTIITDEGLGGLAVQASDGRLLGFTVSGGISVGCWSTGTAYSSTVSHCNITSAGMAIQINVPRSGQAVRPIIENNIITGSTGIYIFGHGNMDGIIRNNVLTSSTGDREGIGVCYRSHRETPYVVNNIFTKLKHGIDLTYTSRLEQRTARICYNNLYNNQENYHIDSPPTPLDLTGVNGNISVSPLFVDYEDGDFHLQSISPCINAGDPEGDYSGQTDIDGEPRVMGCGVDIGADEFTVVNFPPVSCIVGGDTIVEAGSGCEARVILDGSCSSDADSTPGTNDDIVHFDWYKVDACDPNFEDFLASGEIIDCNLPLGEHIIVLEVIDKACAFDTNKVTIIVQDTTPPDFTLSVTPTTLWPVNHKMVQITPSWMASDICDASPEVSLVSITMNEGDDTKGDGHTTLNIQIGDDGSIYLRAERSGTGSGRIYTITYQAVDDSGNVAVASATVKVPHDQRKAK